MLPFQRITVGGLQPCSQKAAQVRNLAVIDSVVHKERSPDPWGAKGSPGNLLKMPTPSSTPDLLDKKFAVETRVLWLPRPPGDWEVHRWASAHLGSSGSFEKEEEAGPFPGGLTRISVREAQLFY